MRKLTIAFLAGLTALGAAAPAAAQRPYGDRDRDGVPNAYDRRPNDGPRGDRDRDGIPNRVDRNNNNLPAYGDRDRDGVPNRYDRNDYSRGFGYRQGWNHNSAWTPYGWGYNDPRTRAWVTRYYGGLSDRNWRYAQRDFYRFADTNRDGIISRWEYDRAMRDLNRFRRY